MKLYLLLLCVAIASAEKTYAHISITDSINKLTGVNSILDRAFVVHADMDDLGKGTYADSQTTGHAGDRLAYDKIVKDGFGFLVNEFLDAYNPFAAIYLSEGKCDTATFEPFVVDFDYKNTSYLLWVDDGSIRDLPSALREGDAMWFGNSTYVAIYCNVNITNYTVSYTGSVGAVKDNRYNPTECLITASNSGYVIASVKIIVKDYVGSDYFYVFPAQNWALIAHTLDNKTYGHWNISVSCPNADEGLVTALDNVVKEVALVEQRNVFHGILHKCAFSVTPEIDVAGFFTE